jgi:hypothetical protein
MTLPVHQLPEAVFTALARGGGGPDAVQRLRSAQLSRVRLLVRALVVGSAEVGHPDAETTRHGYDALRRLERHAPDAVARLLRYPPVGAWAAQTVRALHAGGAGPANPGFLAAMTGAVAGAADGGRCPRVPVVEVHSEELRLVARLDGVTWGHALGAGYRLAHDIDDGDPDVALWRSRLGAAWRLLTRHHRTVAEEVGSALRVLVPLRTAGAGLRSGTFDDAFGAVCMSTPAGPRITAVTLAHEIQHAKLGALMSLFPLTDADPRRRYYAGWRDDPRPFDGLLQGAYAHLGVAGFWRRQRHCERDRQARLRAETEFVRWRDAAHAATRVLRGHPGLTATGEYLVRQMAEVLTQWRTEPVSGDAAAAAGRIAQRHRARWRRRNPVPAR